MFGARMCTMIAQRLVFISCDLCFIKHVLTVGPLASTSTCIVTRQCLILVAKHFLFGPALNDHSISVVSNTVWSLKPGNYFRALGAQGNKDTTKALTDENEVLRYFRVQNNPKSDQTSTFSTFRARKSFERNKALLAGELTHMLSAFQHQRHRQDLVWDKLR